MENHIRKTQPDILRWKSISKYSSVPDNLADILKQPENQIYITKVNKIIQRFCLQAKSIVDNPFRNFFLNCAFNYMNTYIKNSKFPLVIETHTLNLIASIYKQNSFPNKK